MREFVEKIANGKFGLMSNVAKQSLADGTITEFVDMMGQQACIDDPDSIKRRYGSELHAEAVKLYNELPECDKKYSTGKPKDL